MQTTVEITESERQTIESALEYLDTETAQEYRDGGTNGFIMALLDAGAVCISRSCYNDIVADGSEFPAIADRARTDSLIYDDLSKTFNELADTLSERLHSADKGEDTE